MHNLLIYPAFFAFLIADPQASSVTIEPDPSASAAATSDLNIRPSERISQQEIVGKLKVQAAIRAARDAMSAGRFHEAVDRLEACIDRAEGSAEYLGTLESAYRGRLTELIAQGQAKEASAIAQRLRSLGADPTSPPPRPAAIFQEAGSPSDSAASPPDAASPPSETASGITPVKKLGQKMAASVRSLIPRAEDAESKESEPIQVRAKLDDSVSLTPSAAPSPNADLQAAADLFDRKQYAEALKAFEKAYQADPMAVQSQRARWGYCLLYVTVEQYNQWLDETPGTIDVKRWRGLKADAQTAKRLAPAIEYTDKVVAAIDDRIRETEQFAQSRAMPSATLASLSYANTAPVPPPLPVAPAAESAPVSAAAGGGWQAVQTRNFIVYHRDPALGQEVAELAERARQYASELWFKGEAAGDWSPKCELYLYSTAQEYGMSTGVAPQSPGHTKVVNSGGQILSRKVHLRADYPSLKHAVLPHEVAHVVFAGRFGAHTVPRWADEGMAVLTEPTQMQNDHLGNLANCQYSGRGLACSEFMTMGEYPGGDRMRDFYAHSVGVCRYLVEQHGHDKLVAFLRAALQSGNYESALRQVYGIPSFSQLESGFRGYVATLGQAATRG